MTAKKDDLSPFNLGENRKKLHKRIKELQPDVSNRAIADMTGSSEKTVRRDAAANAAVNGSGNDDSQVETDAGAANAAPDTIDQDGRAAGEDVAKRWLTLEPG